MKQAAIVIPFFGKWPEWMDLYLDSLAKNPQLDVLFFTDISHNGLTITPHNAKFHYISFEDYCLMASHKLGIIFNPTRPYKLCDLKPFYPIIHHDELKDYEYVGWGDIDLVYGNLDYFFPSEMMQKYDIISTHCERFSGHFTLLRNKAEVYDISFNIPNWESLLTDESNHGLDESKLTNIMTPRLRYLRSAYYRLGGFTGRLGHLNCMMLGKAAALLYPRYHLKEMWTTPKPPVMEYEYHNGHIMDQNGHELPYLHFLFFKKTPYLPDNTDYWKSGFYKVTPEDLICGKTIVISKSGLYSKPTI